MPKTPTSNSSKFWDGINRPLLALMNLELWSRMYFDRHEAGDVAAELRGLDA